MQCQDDSKKGAVLLLTIDCHAFFLLAIPIKPIRPEPNNHTAAGTGTAGVPVTKPDPVKTVGSVKGGENEYNKTSSAETPIVPPAFVKAASN